MGPAVGTPSGRLLDATVRRKALKLLLEGEADKSIAKKLGLSPHTVNQYVKGIFRHFGVRSRAELMARWIKRGWSGRAAWADGGG